MDNSTEKRRQFFTDVYSENLWNSPESKSGEGSTIEGAKTLIDSLPHILGEYRIDTFLDVPCGDFNWMQHVEFGETHYIGGDIVPDIIRINKELYFSASREFVTIDIVRDKLPAADMLFTRDCFIHFSIPLIFEALENISKTSIKYICMTHDRDHPRYPNGENIELDRAPGGVNYEYRPLNFELPPFSFPPPVDFVREPDDRKDFGGGGDYVMAIWEIEQIRQAVRRA